MPKLMRHYLPIALLLSAAVYAGPVAAQKVPTGNVTVELFALATNGFDPVVEAFNKQYPNITVKLTKFGTDEMKQALRVGASSGKMPDVWFNWGGSLASAYNKAGLALDLTPRIKELKLDETLIPSAIKTFSTVNHSIFRSIATDR